MEGIYAIYYTGATGSGQGLILFKNGIIAGADVMGVLYDGHYIENKGVIEGSIQMNLPAGVMLVTGASSGSEPMVLDVPFNLPSNFGNGNPLPLRTPTGPINIIFKRLRDIP